MTDAYHFYQIHLFLKIMLFYIFYNLILQPLVH